jgi:hypothetical protein
MFHFKLKQISQQKNITSQYIAKQSLNLHVAIACIFAGDWHCMMPDGVFRLGLSLVYVYKYMAVFLAQKKNFDFVVFVCSCL